MAKEHCSISNHNDSIMDPHSSDSPDQVSYSSPGPSLTLSYPILPSSTPTTQIFDSTRIPSPAPSPDPTRPPTDPITTSLAATLELARNIVAALDTYISKMRTVLAAGRMPSIAVHEIRCAHRYQSVLNMKMRRMELIEAVLGKYLAEHGDGEVSISWDDASQKIWTRELEYVRKARRYLIESHVFYKINYELAK